jgi:hypothetical protein
MPSGGGTRNFTASTRGSLSFEFHGRVREEASRGIDFPHWVARFLSREISCSEILLNPIRAVTKHTVTIVASDYMNAGSCEISFVVPLVLYI